MKDYFERHGSWYFKTFYEKLGDCSTHKEAWLLTEEIHFNRFEFNRYTSYDSFREGKTSYMESMKKRRIEKVVIKLSIHERIEDVPEDHDPDQMVLF